MNGQLLNSIWVVDSTVEGCRRNKGDYYWKRPENVGYSLSKFFKERVVLLGDGTQT